MTSNVSNKIRTTGELRDFLATMIIGVKNGQIEAEKARNITKLAAQVNESLYSEIKAAKTQAELGRDVSQLGELPIGKIG